jgi:hypothetical protein
MGQLIESSPFTALQKFQNACKYMPIVDTGRILAKHEIFKHVLGVPGHIIECGVFQGGGLMTWAQLSAIHEPLNHVRRIVGFDTFEGFPTISDQDRSTASALADAADFAVDNPNELTECIRLYDLYRPLGHIPRVELVKGNALETIPQYREKTPHLVVSMLYLDFDLYDATKLAIETFLPLMPRGAVIAFDQLVHAAWPGETLALVDSIGINKLKLQKFSWQPQITFAVLD